MYDAFTDLEPQPGSQPCLRAYPLLFRKGDPYLVDQDINCPFLGERILQDFSTISRHDGAAPDRTPCPCDQYKASSPPALCDVSL